MYPDRGAREGPRRQCRRGPSQWVIHSLQCSFDVDPEASGISVCSPHWLLTVPPFVMVSTDVSWQLAPMSSCAGFVLS